MFGKDFLLKLMPEVFPSQRRDCMSGSKAKHQILFKKHSIK